MEYLKVQNFSGFNQIAICPGVWVPPGSLQKSSRSLSSVFTSNDKDSSTCIALNPNFGKGLFQGHFFIVDKFENSHEKVYKGDDFTYIPYFPGHFYYLYRGNGDNGKQFTYYESSEDIRKLLLNEFETNLVSFNALKVNVSPEFVPHFTLSSSEDLSFLFEDPDTTTLENKSTGKNQRIE